MSSGYIFAVLVSLGLLALINPAAAQSTYSCLTGAECDTYVKGSRSTSNGVTYCCYGTSITTETIDGQPSCECDGFGVDGNWASWGSWSGCSKTCGAGTKIRNRTCTNPAPAHGGLYCHGSKYGSKTCNTQLCPGIINPAATYACLKGDVCDGDINQVEYGGVTYCCRWGHRRRWNVNTDPISCECNEAKVNNWGPWGSWTGCSRTCGTGTKTRSRTCTNPAPSNDGLQCHGYKDGSKPCYTKPCPNSDSDSDSDSDQISAVNGNWASWGSWSGCSKTCGAGTKTRNRTCTNPAPAHGGQQCDESMSESKTCNTKPCPTPTTAPRKATTKSNNSSQLPTATWISVCVTSIISLVF